MKLFFFAQLLITSASLAHDPGISNATIELGGERIGIQLHFAKTDLDALGDAPVNELAMRSVEWRTATGLAPISVIKAEAIDANSVEFTLEVPRMAGEFRSALLAELPQGHRQVLVLRNHAEASHRIEMLSARRATETITPRDLEVTAAPHAAATEQRSAAPWLKVGGLALVILVSLVFCGRTLTSFVLSPRPAVAAH
jgi:hypothetical protein